MREGDSPLFGLPRLPAHHGLPHRAELGPLPREHEEAPRALGQPVHVGLRIYGLGVYPRQGDPHLPHPLLDQVRRAQDQSPSRAPEVRRHDGEGRFPHAHLSYQERPFGVLKRPDECSYCVGLQAQWLAGELGEVEGPARAEAHLGRVSRADGFDQPRAVPGEELRHGQGALREFGRFGLIGWWYWNHKNYLLGITPSCTPSACSLFCPFSLPHPDQFGGVQV